MPSKKSTPVPIAIPNEMLARIKAVAEKMHMKQQDVMRLAMEVGLEDLKRCGYNLAAAVVDKVKGSSETHEDMKAAATPFTAHAPGAQKRSAS